MKHFPSYLLPLACLAALVSGLAGCGPRAPSPPSPSETSSETPSSDAPFYAPSDAPPHSRPHSLSGNPPPDTPQRVTIAVATNFHHVAIALRAAYHAASPAAQPAEAPAPRIDIVAGSSGKLLAQIKNGAPFDIFLSADRDRAQAAEEMGLGVPGARYTYALGRLALWSKDRSLVPSVQKEALARAFTQHRSALANPALAPYGRAAIDILTSTGLKPGDLDLIYGENISQAFSFAVTGQADLAITSLSLAQHYANGHSPARKSPEAGYALIPASWHQPVHQQAVFLQRAAHNRTAQNFWDFLKSPAAQRVIDAAGYDTPTGSTIPDQKPVQLPHSSGQGQSWLEGLRPLWLSIRLAASTTFILLCLGTPLAWWLATSTSRLKPVIEAATALPLVLPPTVLGFYLLVLFNPGAPLGASWVSLTGTSLTFSFTGLVFASTLYSLPFMVQPLQTSFQSIGQRPLEAAASLRAGPFDRFCTVTVPLAKRGFITGSILSFTHTIGEFGVILMVGGNIPTQTRMISIAIYEHVETLNYGEANRLSAILLLFSFVTLLWVYSTNRQAIPHGR